MSVSDEAWADIRRAYAESSESVAAIARAAGVSASAVYRLARLEGWSQRSGGRAAGKNAALAAAAGCDAAVGCDAGRPKPAPGAKAPAGAAVAKSKRANGNKMGGAGKGAAKPTSVVKRLYRAIDLKLKRLEERMQSSDELSAADSEREARELSSMIRSFEKVTEVAADIDKRRKPVASERKPVRPEDAERMRREIAERLERLHATGLPDTGSE